MLQLHVRDFLFDQTVNLETWNKRHICHSSQQSWLRKVSPNTELSALWHWQRFHNKLFSHNQTNSCTVTLITSLYAKIREILKMLPSTSPPESTAEPAWGQVNRFVKEREWWMAPGRRQSIIYHCRVWLLGSQAKQRKTKRDRNKSVYRE